MQGGFDDKLLNYVAKREDTVRYPLKDHEVRFMVPCEQLPSEMSAALRGRVQRSYIIDKRDRSRNLEVSAVGPKRSLHGHLDKGSAARPSRIWAFTKRKLRGWSHWDPCHWRPHWA